MPYTNDIEGTQTPDSKQETNDMKQTWLTIKDYEVEREHATLSAAVFWAQGTHCTDDRPRREGGGFMLRRTFIVKRSKWEQWLNPNRTDQS